MNRPDLIHAVEGYAVSRDYPRLISLMRQTSVPCIVDYDRSHGDGPLRDIAKTIWRRSEDGSEDFQIGARGTGYVAGATEAEFIRACKICNVEFFDRPSVEHEWCGDRPRGYHDAPTDFNEG